MIKTFHIAGVGYIMGEVITPDKMNHSVVLEFPAALNSRSDGQGGNHIQLSPAVPTFIVEYEEIMKRYKFPKDMIILTGTPKPELEHTYKEWAFDMRASIAGIVVPANQGAQIIRG